MGIYLLSFITIPICSLFIKNKRTLVIVISTQLYLILAFRWRYLGVDLVNYEFYYNYYKTCSFKDIITVFIGTSTIDYQLEAGYILFNWILGKLGLDFQSYLIIHATICIFSIEYFIYKNSKDPALSFAFFCAFGGYGYFFGVLRQSLGLAVFLFSVSALKKRCWWKYFLGVLIASTFHYIFLFTALLYFLNMINMKRIHVAITLVLGLVLVVVTPPLFRFVINPIFELIGKDYDLYGFQWNNMSLLIMAFALLLMVFLVDEWNYEKKYLPTEWKGVRQLWKNRKPFRDYTQSARSFLSKEISKERSPLFWTFLLAIPFQSISFYLPIFSRASIGIFMCFFYVLISDIKMPVLHTLFPEAMKTSDKTTILALEKMIVYALLFVFYVYNLQGSAIVPYISLF